MATKTRSMQHETNQVSRNEYMLHKVSMHRQNCVQHYRKTVMEKSPMMKNREDETEEGKCGSDMRKVEEKATHPDTGK